MRSPVVGLNVVTWLHQPFFAYTVTTPRTAPQVSSPSVAVSEEPIAQSGTFERPYDHKVAAVSRL